MKKTVLTYGAGILMLFIFLGLAADEPDLGYMKAFGYGSVCVSGGGYPQFAKYDPAQFDFRDGKFYIAAKTQFDLRAILPQGKTYGTLIDDFVKRKPHARENREDKVIWRIFASHDKNGNKIYDKFPPAPGDMLSVLAYMTSEKEMVFAGLRALDVMGFTGSGVRWTDENVHLMMLCYEWLFNAKPGWQLYIVHTVGYMTRHEGNDQYVVDNPICTALVEVK